MKDMSSKIILDYMHQVAELQSENCLLKDKLEHDEKLLKKARRKISEKENIRHKAIEYINNIQIYGMRSGKTLYGKIMRDLLNILQGDDINE